MRPQAFVLDRVSPRTAGRPHGNYDTGPSHPGELVDPTAHQTRSRVTQYNWSNLRAFGPEPESKGRGGRQHGPLDPGGGQPGQLFDPAGPHAWAQARVDRVTWTTLRDFGHWPESPGTACRTKGTRPRALVAWDSWLTLQALGHVPEFPGRAGRCRGPSDLVPSRAVQLINPEEIGRASCRERV